MYIKEIGHNIFEIDSGIEGPIITILGGIHGNETSGIETIDFLKKELLSKKLLKGKLILIYGNELAIQLKKKQIKYNLNRLFLDKYFEQETTDYEINRAKELKNIFDITDILLDIHSTSSKTEPFIFAENIGEELNIAKEIGPKRIITGWEQNSGGILSGDTNLYMHKIGKLAFTLECGDHYCPNAKEIGIEVSLNLLYFYGLLIGKIDKKDKSIINMYKIHTTFSGNFKFSSGISNFQNINKGELIGYDGNKKIIADNDFIILLPNYEKLSKGEEIFYKGNNISS